jgi:hypothetical protein
MSARCQAAKRDPPSNSGELGEDVAQLEHPPLRLPVGGYKQHLGLGERVAQEPQEQQRRLVPRVNIVERHQQRPLRGGSREEAADRVEEANPLALRYDPTGCPAPSGTRVAERSEPLEIAAKRTQDLHPRPVRRRTPLLPTATRDHTHAALPSDLRDLAHQPGLADAWLAGEEHKRAAAGSGVLKRGYQIRQLLDASDERARGSLGRRSGRHLLHRPSSIAASVDRTVPPV